MSPIVGITEDTDAIRGANGFWRLQLGMLTSDSMNERECLIDTMGYDIWWDNFQRYVIPFIIANRLPHPLHTAAPTPSSF